MAAGQVEQATTWPAYAFSLEGVFASDRAFTCRGEARTVAIQRTAFWSLPGKRFALVVGAMSSI